MTCATASRAASAGSCPSASFVNMKLHMKIVDAHRFWIRKCPSGPNAIIASDGEEVHVEVGELRYSEHKEMLVKLELDNDHGLARMAHDGLGDNGGADLRALNTTDQFVALSLGDGPND